MRRFFALLAVLLSSCGEPSELDELASATPLFSPLKFFENHTEGSGVLKTIFTAGHPVLVRSFGRVTPDGSLVLSQDVYESGKDATHREWRIREVTPRHYRGSLSGADGSVRGEVSGNRMHLRFRTKGGLAIEQWLFLERGGQSALNHMVVRKFGMVVSRLRETIRRCAVRGSVGRGAAPAGTAPGVVCQSNLRG